jgi:hypothetical protein
MRLVAVGVVVRRPLVDPVDPAAVDRLMVGPTTGRRHVIRHRDRGPTSGELVHSSE